MENILIFKVKEKKNEKGPDYRLTYFDKETKKSTDVGAGWVKETNKGKYISVQFARPYKDKKGYKLVEYSGNVEQKQNKVVSDDSIPF